MIKKLSVSEAENEILDGVLILILFTFLSFSISTLTLWMSIAMIIIELFIVFVLAIVIEEIFLSIKKAHFWVILIGIFFSFSAIVLYIFSGSLIQIILLTITTYLLLHRFNKIAKKN